MEIVEDDESIIKIIHGEIKKLPTKGSSPSFIPEESKKDGYLGILTNKSIAELEDLLARQRRIMDNKSFTSKLKDGGLKLKTRYKEIKHALQEVKDQDSKEHGVIQNIDKLEWRSTQEIVRDDEVNEGIIQHHSTDDPLYLMATHSQKIPAKSPQINEEDYSMGIIEELKSLSIQDGADVNEEADSFPEHNSQNYKSKMLSKLNGNAELGSKKLFKTNRTSKGAIPTQPKPEVISLWEESSATGPTTFTNRKGVKLISLKESYNLHHLLQAKKAKQVLQAASTSLVQSASFSYHDVNATRNVLRPREDDLMFHNEN